MHLVNCHRNPDVIANDVFACGGYSEGVSAEVCGGGGEGYVLVGISTPGPILNAGYTPQGASNYLRGFSAGANGLPGYGISFTNGNPTANSYIIGAFPGAGASYGVSFTDIGNSLNYIGNQIAGRVSNDLDWIANGFYDLAGRPYDPDPEAP